MTISLSELAEKISLAATYSSLGEVVISEEEADAVVAALRELEVSQRHNGNVDVCAKCELRRRTDAALAGVGGKGITP